MLLLYTASPSTPILDILLNLFSWIILTTRQSRSRLLLPRPRPRLTTLHGNRGGPLLIGRFSLQSPSALQEHTCFCRGHDCLVVMLLRLTSSAAPRHESNTRLTRQRGGSHLNGCSTQRSPSALQEHACLSRGHDRCSTASSPFPRQPDLQSLTRYTRSYCYCNHAQLL